MRQVWILAALALASACAPAAAGDLAPTPAPACDFFKAELIGEYCARTAYFGVSGAFSDEVRSQNFPSPPFRTAFSASNEYRNSTENATLAISPWQGVRFTLQGGAGQFNNSIGYTETFPQQNVTTFNPARQTSGSGAGYFVLGGAATVWDRPGGLFGTSRSIVSVFGDFGALPQSSYSRGNTELVIGYNSGARWELGNGLSADYFSQTSLVRYDNPNDVRLNSTMRLLLASDVGVAIGPELVSLSDLGHDPSLKLGWSAWALGGRVIAEPFRFTHVPVLSDVTVEGYGRRYLGQADLVAPWLGSASATDFGGSARVNFRF